MSISQLQTHDQPNPFRAVIFRGEPDDTPLVEGHVTSVFDFTNDDVVAD